MILTVEIPIIFLFLVLISCFITIDFWILNQLCTFGMKSSDYAVLFPLNVADWVS